MKPKCSCGVPYSRGLCSERDDLIYQFYQCPICGVPTHDVSYKYTPDTCPGHQVEFIGTKLVDGPHAHTITHLCRCTRCGAIRETARDTNRAGLSGRIEVDDPRVTKTLLLNKSSWERLIPKELHELRTTPLPQEVVLPSEG